MNISDYLYVSPEVENALKANKPVVALESTIISHGMPYPKNVRLGAAIAKAMCELND